MGIADRLRNSFNDDDEEAGILPQLSSATTLGWGSRVRGFIICLIIGLILSILGSIMLWVNTTAFAVLYSLGTITSLASTMFLMGPCNQLKKMVDPTRLFCTIALLACVIMTFVSALALNLPALALLFCVLQFLALTWYSLSYIPFARKPNSLFGQFLTNHLPVELSVSQTLTIYLIYSLLILHSPVFSSLTHVLAAVLDLGYDDACHEAEVSSAATPDGEEEEEDEMEDYQTASGEESASRRTTLVTLYTILTS